MAMAHRLSFEGFELDLAALELYREGEPLKLPPQPVRVLALLARGAGQVVTREELRRELWGDDTHVDFEGSLHSCIKQVRAALGDDASSPRFIETLPRRGYRFLPEVRSGATRPSRRRGWLLAALAATVAVAGLFLSGMMSASSRRAHDASPEAREALLKARYLLNKPDDGEPTSLDAAERYFREAIDLDARLVEAHEGLAEVSLRRGLSSGALDAYEAAVASSERALALAPPDEPPAAALFSRAMGLWYGRWDWDGAGESFERALAQDDELARAHHWYAYYLSGLGRHEEALREIERARELDPLSPAIQSDVGWFYFFAGRYEKALAASRRTLEIEPRFVLAEDCIVECYLALGRKDAAIREASRFAQHSFETLDALWRARLDSGRGPYDAGLAALRLGHEDEALELLREAVARRSLWLPVLRVDPRWSSIRDRPELVALEREVGLVEPRRER